MLDVRQIIDNDVVVNEEDVSKFIKGKNILVTGASGSIGSELIRYICGYQPASIVAVDRNENSQFWLEAEIRRKFPGVRLRTYLASVADRDRMATVFRERPPHIVFHAAANKHVPLSETNVAEAIKTNIFGTKVVANLAADAKCEAFVLISTDKAVNPTSVMGATKRVAEYYITSLGQRCSTKYVAVRFCNVLGSSGSVFEIFNRQIENDEDITITHPDMTRFFIRPDEAVKLLVQAACFNISGTFVLMAGKSTKITDLADLMVKASGKPIKILISSPRPGEKVTEEIVSLSEDVSPTSHKQIERVTVTLPKGFADRLAELDLTRSESALKTQLRRLVPEAKLSTQ